MDDAQFHELIDELILQIEDAIDEQDLDIDVDASGSLLTMECPDGSSIILSRQNATHELWVAAKSGGFHLRYQNNGWYCGTSLETFPQLLNRVLTEQLGQPVSLIAES